MRQEYMRFSRDKVEIKSYFSFDLYIMFENMRVKSGCYIAVEEANKARELQKEAL